MPLGPSLAVAKLVDEAGLKPILLGMPPATTLGWEVLKLPETGSAVLASVKRNFETAVPGKQRFLVNKRLRGRATH